MSSLWSRQAKYERWLDVELAICEAYAADGVIPQGDWDAIRDHAGFTLERCDAIELETRHDLAAFVRALEESVAAAAEADRANAGRWIHFGVTSYDVIDTALGMMLRDSCDVLQGSLAQLIDAVRQLKTTYAATPAIGRTHGIHAEPITFGSKLAGWETELRRGQVRLTAAQDDVSVGKISGAVGIHAHVSPELETRILSRLGLRSDPVSTQIVNRDRLANLLCVLAVLAGGLERIATELRNLQRTEILEVQEAFAKGQTGSSAMPHKRNPWNSETVVGLARIVRGNAGMMLETIATWHERDLTNSSLERVILPDTFQLVDFMLGRLTRILAGLVVMPERMRTNLEQMGDLVFSEHLMIALIRKGLSRRDAYGIAQRHAARSWEGADFQTSVREDPDVAERLTHAELDEVFSLSHHLRHANHAVRISESPQGSR
ncbi:MAG TPA: adenylosuccinate lyase [Fimbriimonadaceae bacterium]|nr:adenylosuccinate lyase [Fimbriimonadaceae bacterium]